MKNLSLKHILLILTTATVTGCSGMIQLMPRDSGRVYSGTVQGSMTGTGVIAVAIDGEQYTGPIVRTSSSDSAGLIQQYGKRAGASFGSTATVGGTAAIKGILSSPNGRGLRCEFTSDGSGGGGVCVDDQSRVYDAIVTR
jgi:hypothetical protein